MSVCAAVVVSGTLPNGIGFGVAVNVVCTTFAVTETGVGLPAIVDEIVKADGAFIGPTMVGDNVIVIVHAPFTGSVKGIGEQVVDASVRSPPMPRLVPLMTTCTLPVLVNVSTRDFEVPTKTVPKSSGVGLRLKLGVAVPVPLNAMTFGPFGASVRYVIVPACGVVLVGWNT